MTLRLSQEHLQTIRTHAETTYPEECCGLILGHLASQGKTAVEVIATENAWSAEDSLSSKKRRYAIAPQVMLQTQKAARDRSLNIVGIYHSHPDYSAAPSEFDCKYAWPEYSYIIVSVQNGKSDILQSWILDEQHQFQPEPIENII
ncbi:Mov34/MPN/PAD-1 family protein [Calothrix sp. PCC 7507]|uniref:Mov34/MPN/PAD-1 family protein n=1 Tax=Calothrix sp. PCC 7507 TaxID=99598 RepID=UPI00029F4E1B|nr:M67 family metallopeptidase [Calothrix sp. PCC 7507]AFY33705.1 Mov34/MPN/PAD-1 family protein [Calothrix sp. PCC 7507]